MPAWTNRATAPPPRGGGPPAPSSGGGQRGSVIGMIIALIVIGGGTTFVYGIWQMAWVFVLIEHIANILVPGQGALLRWSLFALFAIFNLMVALQIGGPKLTAYDPQTGRVIKVYPQLMPVIFTTVAYAIIVMVLPIMFGKPLITNWILQPAINAIVAAGQGDIATQIVDVAQRGGIALTLPSAQRMSLEEQLCGGYKKFDEQGNEIKGGKPISVTVDAPPWSSKGSFYRATLKINNLGKEPVNVIVVSGEVTSKEEKETAKGSYMTGKNRDGKTDKFFGLTPLNCLEPKGCLIEPGLERTVDVVNRDPIVFKDSSFATIKVEAKVEYDSDEKKNIGNGQGIGNGHLLIFKDSQDAAARQKDPNFKSSYCPNAFAGPLDVVVIPPFYTVGDTSKGGDGYFDATGIPEACPTEISKQFRLENNYCLQNVKIVKVRLVNTDSDAKIVPKFVKVCPYETQGECGDGKSGHPSEYTNASKGADVRGNCFLETFGEGENGIVFNDESGIEETPLKALGTFRKEITFLCRYQINDFPSGFGYSPITDFRAYQFRAEVKYDYVTTFTKSSIPMSDLTK